MVVYNLEESLDVFITPRYFNNAFVYDMELVNGEDSRKTIRTIDLRKDKLVIYGTEVSESMVKRLHESLILRPKLGIIYVNCVGACYVVIASKAYRPIHNVMFDWSSFGVIVPNSINDSLRKKVEELKMTVENSRKEGELARIEVESSKVSLKASNDEVNEIKMVQNEMGLKMQKVYEKVALVDFELELYKIELESCKKELDEVLDDLCNCKIEKEKREVELHKARVQLSSEISAFEKSNREMEMKMKLFEDKLSLMCLELNASKDQREFFENNVKELEDRLLGFKNEYEDLENGLKRVQDELVASNEIRYTMEVELQKLLAQHSAEISSNIQRNSEMELKLKKLEQELSLARSELRSTKDDRDFLDKIVKELEEQISSSTIQFQNLKDELKQAEDKLFMSNKEVHTIKVELKKQHDQLSFEIFSLNQKNSELQTKLKKLEDELSLVQSELYSTKDQRESLRQNLKEHEERLLSSENRNQEMIKELKVQIKCYKKEQQCMETLIQKIMSQIKSINLGVKSSNQKLDQVLISSLWKDFNHSHDKVSLPCTKCGHIALVSNKEFGFPPPTLEIIAQEI